MNRELKDQMMPEPGGFGYTQINLIGGAILQECNECKGLVHPLVLEPHNNWHREIGGVKGKSVPVWVGKMGWD